MTRPRLRLVVASANPDKVREIDSLLGTLPGLELVARPTHVPEVVEDGDSLLDNARLKARALVVATGDAAVADDTGLEIDALAGAPGVHSARFAGEHATDAENVAKVTASLDRAGALTPERRRARFRTVALVAFADGGELWTEGEVLGSMAAAPRGSGGFGYDPVFVPDGSGGRTFAELTREEKDALSHRGRAFRELALRLAQRG